MSDQLRLFVMLAATLGAETLIARQFERKWPIDPNIRQADIVADWKVTCLNLLLWSVLRPLTAVSAVAIVNAAGGGFIELRTDGWWYAASLIGFILVADLYGYGFHRAQHAVPVLWKMHSFHHSAEAMTFLTGARHYWLERVLENAFIPIMAILFRVTPEMAGIAGIIYFLPDGCAHLNVRIRLGRYVTWLNNPQFHRIHHSTQPEHFDKNFASLLPLWDIVFGTAWIPRPDEYPATGLVPSEKVGLVDSIVWPFRRHLRQYRAGAWKSTPVRQGGVTEVPDPS